MFASSTRRRVNVEGSMAGRFCPSFTTVVLWLPRGQAFQAGKWPRAKEPRRANQSHLQETILSDNKFAQSMSFEGFLKEPYLIGRHRGSAQCWVKPDVDSKGCTELRKEN